VSDSCFIHTSKVSSLAPTAAIFLAWKQKHLDAKQHNDNICGAKQHNNDIFGAKQYNNDIFDAKQSQQWHWKKLSRGQGTGCCKAGDEGLLGGA